MKAIMGKYIERWLVFVSNESSKFTRNQQKTGGPPRTSDDRQHEPNRLSVRATPVAEHKLVAGLRPWARAVADVVGVVFAVYRAARQPIRADQRGSRRNRRPGRDFADWLIRVGPGLYEPGALPR